MTVGHILSLVIADGKQIVNVTIGLCSIFHTIGSQVTVAVSVVNINELFVFFIAYVGAIFGQILAHVQIGHRKPHWCGQFKV